VNTERSPTSLTPGEVCLIEEVLLTQWNAWNEERILSELSCRFHDPMPCRNSDRVLRSWWRSLWTHYPDLTRTPSSLCGAAVRAQRPRRPLAVTLAEPYRSDTSSGSLWRMTLRQNHWISLAGAVLVTGCTVDTSDPVPRTGANTGAEASVPAIPLNRLEVVPVGPVTGQRDPFRLVAPLTDAEPANPLADGEPARLEPVPTPENTASARETDDMPLTFIGFVESPGVDGRIVVLTDGNSVFHGRMGEVVDGRYRIVGIDSESIEVEGVDGSDKRTLRLPGESC